MMPALNCLGKAKSPSSELTLQEVDPATGSRPLSLPEIKRVGSELVESSYQ